MESKGIHPNQLAKDLGVSRVSVSRWLSGKGFPSAVSCYKIAEYAEISVEKILYITGQIPYKSRGEIELPSFREYAKKKYSKELDGDIITMIEHFIAIRRERSNGRSR